MTATAPITLAAASYATRACVAEDLAPERGARADVDVPHTAVGAHARRHTPPDAPVPV
ncbi:hypothetical protein [Trujillonella endophytica]|uniref:Uncharacterized protein n=1 Tax=Trujillonella endophytica TaxID=673521 RepID=A0A1H8QN80_9ACTN|nr:hypothetical protein [Trujillella endophytica]SEO55506.1 hypothetical protein SAMN05660991_00695 [Trujillella endophytica]